MKLFYKLCYVRDATDVAYPSSIQGACYHRVLCGSVEEHLTTKLKTVLRFRSSRVNQISFLCYKSEINFLYLSAAPEIYLLS